VTVESRPGASVRAVATALLDDLLSFSNRPPAMPKMTGRAVAIEGACGRGRREGRPAVPRSARIAAHGPSHAALSQAGRGRHAHRIASPGRIRPPCSTCDPGDRDPRRRTPPRPSDRVGPPRSRIAHRARFARTSQRLEPLGTRSPGPRWQWGSANRSGSSARRPSSSVPPAGSGSAGWGHQWNRVPQARGQGWRRLAVRAAHIPLRRRSSRGRTRRRAGGVDPVCYGRGPHGPRIALPGVRAGSSRGAPE
jgi:hypothetical protein